MRGFKGTVILGVALTIVFSIFHLNTAEAATAAPVKLAWSASPNPGVNGYKVCYGLMNSAVTNQIDVGTNLQVTLADLYDQTNYFFYVVAYATNRVESAPSNQLQYRPSMLTPVQLAVQDTGAVQVQFRGPANAACTVQYTDSLEMPDWQVLDTVVAADDGSVAIDDPAAAGVSARFYRALVYP